MSNPNTLCVCIVPKKPLPDPNSNLLTQAMLYSNRAVPVVAPSNWTTRKYQVIGQVIAPLANNYSF